MKNFSAKVLCFNKGEKAPGADARGLFFMIGWETGKL